MAVKETQYVPSGFDWAGLAVKMGLYTEDRKPRVDEEIDIPSWLLHATTEYRPVEGFPGYWVASTGKIRDIHGEVVKEKRKSQSVRLFRPDGTSVRLLRYHVRVAAFPRTVESYSPDDFVLDGVTYRPIPEFESYGIDASGNVYGRMNGVYLVENPETKSVVLRRDGKQHCRSVRKLIREAWGVDIPR